MFSRLWLRSGVWFTLLLLIALPVLAQTGTTEGQIVFGCVIDGQSDICIVNPDGSGLLRLTNDPNWDLSPRFSPDGTRIAFISHPIRETYSGRIDYDNSEEVYVMRADGSQRRRLTWYSDIAAAPDWSPDGAQIGYHIRDTQTNAVVMWTYDIEAGISRQVLDNATGLSWSPDGTQFAFAISDETDTQRHIFVMDIDGGNLRQLTIGHRFDLKPIWSPDGSQIAFSEYNYDARAYDLFIMDANGNNLRQLTADAAEDFLFDWSPDGQYLLFSSDRALTYLFMLNLQDDSVEPLPLPEGVSGYPLIGGIDWSATAHVTEVAPPVTIDEYPPSGLWMETWAEPERVCRSGEQLRSFSNQPFLLTVAEDGNGLEVNYLLTGETVRLPRTEPDFFFGSLENYHGEAFGESHVAWLTHMEYAFLETFNEECFISNGAAWDFVTNGDYCALTAVANPHLRSGPGTNFQQVGTLTAGDNTIAFGQATGADGYVWYRLYDNKWVRSDLMDTESTCTTLPSP